jgi:hypothetical protein
MHGDTHSRDRWGRFGAGTWGVIAAVALSAAIGITLLASWRKPFFRGGTTAPMSEPQRIDAYKIALDAIDRDGQALWTAFGAFLLAETVLLAFALNALFSDKVVAPTWNLGSFMVALLGLVVCIPWWVTNYRSATIRDFRIFQALDLEADPSRLLREGKELVECGEARAHGKTFTLRFFARRPFTNAFWVRFLIFTWFVADLAVLTLSGPWWRA